MTNTESIARSRGKGECGQCDGAGWTEYTSETLDGTTEQAQMLCRCNFVVDEKPEKQIDPRTARILRGIDLWNGRGNEIEIVDEETFRVPSCTGHGKYRVELRDSGDDCNCVDFRRNDFGLFKHSVAGVLAWAKRLPVELPVTVEHQTNIRDHDGRHLGSGYVIVEVLQRRSVLEVLPNMNTRMYSRRNTGGREAGEVVARCANRGEAYRAIQELVSGREVA